MSEETGFCDLPNEIALYILSFHRILSPADLASFGRCSKWTRELSEESALWSLWLPEVYHGTVFAQFPQVKGPARTKLAKLVLYDCLWFSCHVCGWSLRERSGLVRSPVNCRMCNFHAALQTPLGASRKAQAIQLTLNVDDFYLADFGVRVPKQPPSEDAENESGGDAAAEGSIAFNLKASFRGVAHGNEYVCDPRYRFPCDIEFETEVASCVVARTLCDNVNMRFASDTLSACDNTVCRLSRAQRWRMACKAKALRGRTKVPSGLSKHAVALYTRALEIAASSESPVDPIAEARSELGA